MFQIITNSSSTNYIEDKQLISVPCFYLTNSLETHFENDSSSTSISNFTPMFIIENTDEEVLDIEDFSYLLSTTPSEYQMLEININDLQPLDDISTLYINGVAYQNLLNINDLILFTTEEDTLPLEEREST